MIYRGPAQASARGNGLKRCAIVAAFAEDRASCIHDPQTRLMGVCGERASRPLFRGSVIAKVCHHSWLALADLALRLNHRSSLIEVGLTCS